MHRTRILSLALASALAGAAAPRALARPEPEAARAAAATITEPRTRAHVDFLASDLLEGRATPSRGLDIAASYIATHFARAGLKPGGEDGGWTQGFPMLAERRLAESRLAVSAGGARGARAFESGKEFTPLGMTGSGAAKGGLVFAGYGITAPEEEYDDYAGLDVTGKVVLVIRKEPRANEEGEPFAGKRTTRHAFFQTKIANAARRGATAIIIVNGPVNPEERVLDGAWPQKGEGTGGGGGRGGERDVPAIPVLQVTPETANHLLSLDASGGGKDGVLASLQAEIDRDLEPRSFEVEGAAIDLAVRVEDVTSEAKNVVGILPGSDPDLRQEAVVFGAHYDHVGVQDEHGPSFYGQIGAPQGGDRIHNGADDNASGTSALLEVARAFAESGIRPRRTLVFVAFAGEELGLLGSRHYVQHPYISNERTVAMVNLDMVGRNDPDHLLLGGTQSAPALGRAIERANESVGMKLERMRSGRLDGASDHASFQAVGIPSLFLFTGDHRDYHRVTDHADKIDAQKIARVGRLAFLIGAEVADDASAGKDREAAKAEAEERAARRRARAEGRGQGEGRGEGGERRRGRRAEGGEERPGQPAPETPTPAPAPKAEPAKKDGAWF